MFEKLSHKYVATIINTACKECKEAIYFIEADRVYFLQKLAAKENQLNDYLQRFMAQGDISKIARKIGKLRFLLGVIQYTKDLYPQALDHFSTITNDSPVYEIMLKYRVLSLIAENHTEEILGSLIHLAQTNPDVLKDGQLFNQFGVAAYHRHNFKLAYLCFTLAARIATAECMANKKKALQTLSSQLEIFDSTISETLPEQLLGEGTFTEVIKGQQTGTAMPVAVKKEIIPGYMNAYKEAAFMQGLNHPHIIELVGVTAGYKTLVMSFACQGSLGDYLAAGSLNQQQQEHLACGIISGIAHLHRQLIIHRDLKSDNIVLAADFSPKITDFGTAYFGFPDVPKQFKYRKGTIAWLAPEALKSMTYSGASDIYAFAIILWEIMTGAKPYSSLRVYEIPDCVIGGYRELIPLEVPYGIRKLIEQCWAHKPQKRPSAERVSHILANHSIFQAQPELTSESESDEEFAAELSSWEFF